MLLNVTDRTLPIVDILFFINNCLCFCVLHTVLMTNRPSIYNYTYRLGGRFLVFFCCIWSRCWRHFCRSWRNAASLAGSTSSLSSSSSSNLPSSPVAVVMAADSASSVADRDWRRRRRLDDLRLPIFPPVTSAPPQVSLDSTPPRPPRPPPLYAAASSPSSRGERGPRACSSESDLLAVCRHSWKPQ